MSDSRLSIPEYAMALAEVASLRSEDPFRKVGAAALDADNRVIATAYNADASSRQEILLKGINDIQPDEIWLKQTIWNDADYRMKGIGNVLTDAHYTSAVLPIIIDLYKKLIGTI